MTPNLRDLLESLRAPLALRGEASRAWDARTATAGFFNPVHPWTVQVLGDAGRAYLAQAGAAARSALPAKLARRGTALLIAAGDHDDLSAWQAAGVVGLHSARPAHEVVFALRAALAQQQAARVVLHGVLLSVHGVGVLVEGAAGAGKSLLALDLVARGHALVADDAVDVVRPAAGILVGRSPRVLQGYLEARPLGVLDLEGMHGARAVRGRQRLDLVVRLQPGRARPLAAAERLAGRRGTRRILGVRLPRLSLALRLGHNLAPLVEAACLDQRLRLDGVDAAAALSRRQARAVRNKE
jgi:HPr kinase/phosphorylase